MKGKILSVYPFIRNRRLKVQVTVMTNNGTIKALLPDRELSVILPRSLFIAEGAEKQLFSISPHIKEIIQSILQRMTRGRIVRIWGKEGEQYAFFQRWGAIEVEECLSTPVKMG